MPVHRSSPVLPRLALPLLLLAATPFPAMAQTPPDGEHLASALRAELPPYWNVRSVEIVATVNDGDAVSPRYRQRFVAKAAPAETLYAPAPDNGVLGPFLVAIPVLAVEETRNLYGIAGSTLARGEWVTELRLENTVREQGEPRSAFPGPVAIAGSEQAGRIAELLSSAQELIATVARARARAEADADALRLFAEKEQAALREAHRRRLAALAEMHEEEGAALATQFDRELAALKAEHARARATSQTLAAVETAKAETAAQRQLAAALVAEAEERAKTAAIAAQIRAAEAEERAARYKTIAEDLASEDPAKRTGAIDAAFASGDAYLRQTAIETVAGSGDQGLQGKVLAALLAASSRIAIYAYPGDSTMNADSRIEWQGVFEITERAPETGMFAGNFLGRKLTSKDSFPNGEGSILGNRLTLRASYYGKAYMCIVHVEMTGSAVLPGRATCDRTQYKVRLHF